VEGEKSLFSLHGKNTNNAKSEVRFKQLIRNPWCVHNRLFNANFEEKLNENPIEECKNMLKKLDMQLSVVICKNVYH
jgi:hypothetical protein